MFTFYKYMHDRILRDWDGIDFAVYNIGSNDSHLGSANFIKLHNTFIDNMKEIAPNTKFNIHITVSVTQNQIK